MAQRATLQRTYRSSRAGIAPSGVAVRLSDASRAVRTILAAEGRHPATAPLLLTMLVVVCASTLWALGQPLICPCGHVALWAGDMATNQNSQQFADAYSIEHAAAGLLVSVLLQPLARVAHSTRLVGVAAGAVGWEFLENSSWMIHRFRALTISVDYAGDSVLNSSTDVIFCCLAFAIAGRLPWRVSFALVALAEVVVTFAIHDSILLSLLALLSGNDALREWQLAR